MNIFHKRDNEITEQTTSAIGQALSVLQKEESNRLISDNLHANHVEALTNTISALELHSTNLKEILKFYMEELGQTQHVLHASKASLKILQTPRKELANVQVSTLSKTDKVSTRDTVNTDPGPVVDNTQTQEGPLDNDQSADL